MTTTITSKQQVALDAVQRAADAQAAAARARKAAARQMAEAIAAASGAGLTYREIGLIVGVSGQRAAFLAKQATGRR